MDKISKEYLIKEIMEKQIFVVSSSSNPADWILLKNGSRTPVFLDTSKFNSYPELLEKINKYIFQIIREKSIKFDRMAGIPYGGLQFSYGLSSLTHSPHIPIRKEGKKTYGTAGALLGDYNRGDKILLLEDATVTADTALGFVNRLKKENLLVSDVITVVDVEGSAAKTLSDNSIKLHNIFTWKELYDFYKNKKPSITQEVKNAIDNFLCAHNQDKK